MKDQWSGTEPTIRTGTAAMSLVLLDALQKK